MMNCIQEKRESGWVLLFEAARVRQWVKNLLIFVPLITSHRLTEGDIFFKAVIAFVSFGFCASGAYTMNDILDAGKDRLHPDKKRRPFASGDLSVRAGILISGMFSAAGLFLAASLSREFLSLAVFYVMAAAAYSLWIKKIKAADILLLAVFYTMRILAGGIAADIPISSWLIVFSVGIFLSLAMSKRVHELKTLPDDPGQFLDGRGYSRRHLKALTVLGGAAGFFTVIVLGFYIQSAEARILYSHAGRLWFLCPVFAFWIFRIWEKAYGGSMLQDPLVFAMRDVPSYASGIAAALILVAAS